MFNTEQRAYMRSLDAIPPERKCWCGWNRLGECRTGCPPDATHADKIAAQCRKCRNAPLRPGMKLTHRKGCAEENQTSEDKDNG